MKRSRGAGPSGVPERPQKIVNHITIHNYFAPREGPTAAPEGGDQYPPQLFPITETRILAPEKRSAMARQFYTRVQSQRSGVLRGECALCPNSLRPIIDFAPATSIKTHRDRADFFAAVVAYTEAYAQRNPEAARAARARVDDLRRAYCQPCAERLAKLSVGAQACKDEWVKLRKDACELHDGCMKDGCSMKGKNRDWRVLQADHVDPEGLLNPANKKVHALSSYNWWSSKGRGGVDGIRNEASKCQWICGFCHHLENTSSTSRRFCNPDDMPDGKQSGSEEERTQYRNKCKAKIRYPKRKYVDDEKVKHGCCAHCKREVTRDTCVAFHFDHIDESSKMQGSDTLAGKTGGVAGLVQNHNSKRASLDEIKSVLDAEMAKCRLLCANCHKLKTWDGENVASDNEGDEE